MPSVELYQPATPADLDPGASRCVAVNGVALIVALVHDGGYYAVQRICPHMNLPLDGGEIRGTTIVCPHHFGRFDLKTGAALAQPAWAPIAAYPTRVRDGMVEVLLDTA